MEFDSAAVSAIAGNEVSLQVSMIEDASIKDAELVVEVTLSGATFDAGKATVTIPFTETVPSGKIAKVYFINGDQRVDMHATFGSSAVVFETNHFSTYAIVFEDIPVESAQELSFLYVLIIALAVIVVAEGIVIVRRKNA